MLKSFDDPQLKSLLKIRKLYLKSLIEKEKSKYFGNLINDSKNKMRTMWDIVHLHTGNSTRKKELPDTIIHDGHSLNSPVDIAESFNNFFTNLTPSSTPDSVVDFEGIKNDFETTRQCRSSPLVIFRPTSQVEILKALSSLRSTSSFGEDEISCNLLKKCVTPILEPLCILFNHSLERGIFPNIYKRARVIPLLKKGDPSFTKNYRPISLLSSFGKLLEKLVYWRIESFLEGSRVFRENQYGFRKERSTVDCIESHLNHIVSLLDKKVRVLNVSCDLSKAFDRVDHDILILKLKFLGFGGPVLNWFQTYLSGRSQFTEIRVGDNSVRSGCVTLRAGVPQGSILGPLLFLCYINDLNTNTPGTFLSLYADDANVIISGSTGNLQNVSQQCLNNIEGWMKRNRLVVNCDKSTVVAFSTRNNTPSMPDLYLSGDRIPYCEWINFLGVRVDRNLNWNEHCNNLMGRLSRACFVLRTLRGVLDDTSLRSAYYAYFGSILTYGIEFWGCFSLAFSIFKIQKRALRIMARKPPGYPCRDLFIGWRIQTVFDTYIFKIALFVHKHLTQFESLNSNHSYYTRSGNDLSYGRHNLTLFERKVRYVGVRVWNNLPRIIRDSSTKLEFKRKMRSFIGEKCFYSLDDFFQM
jgi:hypothetical protein